jgi:hypothetical protein
MKHYPVVNTVFHPQRCLAASVLSDIRVLKVRQGLTIQQSLKHPGLVNLFLQGHQVLNLTEGHYQLDPILWVLHPSLKIAIFREK